MLPRPFRAGPADRAAIRWLWAIAGVGLVLRIVPIWFALEYPLARPDEETAIGHATAMLGGDLNPHFFHWPSLTFYLFASLLGAASWIQRTIFGEPLAASDSVIVARAFVAVAGTATIVVLFGLARRVGGDAVGLIAAAYLAVALLHVRESHFAMTDVIMTLLLVASLALLLRALDGAMRDARDRRALAGFAAAGVIGGLAASTKYSAAPLLCAYGAAQLVCLARWWGTRDRLASCVPMLLLVPGFVVGFVAGTPYAVLDATTFVEHLRFDFTHLSGGHGVDVGRGWSYHLTRSLPYGLGVPAFVLAIAGIPFLAVRHGRTAIVLGAFAIVFYASLGSGYTVFFRYMLPLVPLLCLSAAIGARDGAVWLAERTRLAPRTVAAVLLTVSIGPGLVNSVWFDVLLAKTDTRVLAADWLGPRLSAGDSIHDTGGIYSRLALGERGHDAWEYDPVADSFVRHGSEVPDWLVLQESPLRLYASAHAALQRLALQRYDLVFTARATRAGARQAVYDHQDAFFLPMSRFDLIERPGPTIRIYRRKDAPVSR